jgi:O-acetyl-ADP-ribose deacetylase (regulator of RNase III)
MCDKNEYLYVHCISLDFALGAGIAKQINARYNMRGKLFDMKNKYPQYFKEFKYGFCVTIDGVSNLITKDKYYNKPTMKTMKEALVSLKKYVENNKVKKIAMPKIGCGLDRLDWNDVSSLIKKIFQDIDVEIVVCYI